MNELGNGVIAAIPSPFNGNGELSEEGLRRVVRYVIDGGVHGIMTTGGTGEFPHLSMRERADVTRIVVSEASGAIPVIAGTAACSTREAISLSREAMAAGADAVILTPPFYFKLPDHALLRHFELVTKAVEGPVFVYNNPLYTGNNLSPPLLSEICSLPGVAGLKQSNTDFGQLVEVIRLVEKTKVSICTGIDSQFYPALCVGATGIFSTAAVVIPYLMTRVYETFAAGDYDAARREFYRIQSLSRFLEYDPGYVAPCKEALGMLGIPVGAPRAPMPELTDEERTELRRALEDLGLLAVA